MMLFVNKVAVFLWLMVIICWISASDLFRVPLVPTAHLLLFWALDATLLAIINN